MALNIKNHRAEKIARQIAAKTGESLTDVVIRALEERFQRLGGRLDPDDISAEINRIALQCSSLPDKDTRTADEILDHGERGLPE